MFKQFCRRFGIAGQKRCNVIGAVAARLRHQRKIGRNRIVVRCGGSDIVGIGRREIVGRQARASGRFASVRVDPRNLLRCGEGFDLTLVVTDLLEVAEGHVLQAVTGRADFVVNLEAALELLDVPLAERAVEGERDIARLFVRQVTGRLFGHRGIGAEHERIERDECEAEPDENGDEADAEKLGHVLSRFSLRRPAWRFRRALPSCPNRGRPR